MDYVSLVAESCAPLLNLHWVLAGMLAVVGLVLQLEILQLTSWELVAGEDLAQEHRQDAPQEVVDLATARAEWEAALRRHVELRAQLLVVERELRRVAVEAAGWRRAPLWSTDGMSGLLVPRRASRLWATGEVSFG